MDELNKVKSSLVIALKWLLKEYVKALLALIASLFLGLLAWIFRKYIGIWLTTKHAIEIFGWLWILISFFVVSLPVLFLWLLGRRKPLYKDEGDVRVMLEEQLDRLSQGRNKTIRIDYRIWDRKLRLKKGSAAKFLPRIIENHRVFCIKSKGEKTVVVCRKGVTIQVSSDHPGGRLI